jgi:hypothetical protein
MDDSTRSVYHSHVWSISIQLSPESWKPELPGGGASRVGHVDSREGAWNGTFQSRTDQAPATKPQLLARSLDSKQASCNRHNTVYLSRQHERKYLIREIMIPTAP